MGLFNFPLSRGQSSERITVSMPEELVDYVKETAKERDIPTSRVITHAVEFEKTMRDEMKKGAKVFVEHSDGSASEVTFD